MKKIVVDIEIPKDRKKKEKSVTFGTRMPESLNKLIVNNVPKEDRAKLNIDFWTKVVKEYAS